MVLVALAVLTIPKRVIAQGELPPPPPPDKWEDGLMVPDLEAAKIAMENSEAEKEAQRKKEAALRRRVTVPTNVIKITDEVPGYTKKQMYNCWNFVKDDIIIGMGAARNHPAPLKKPEIGAIMVSYEGPKGHYSRVLAVFEKEFVIGEFNFESGYYTERVIPNNYPLIKGFYKK